MILTDRGEVPVETLTVGDSIMTLFNEMKPITSIGFGRSLVTSRNRCDVPSVIAADQLLPITSRTRTCTSRGGTAS